MWTLLLIGLALQPLLLVPNRPEAWHQRADLGLEREYILERLLELRERPPILAVRIYLN